VLRYNDHVSVLHEPMDADFKESLSRRGFLQAAVASIAAGHMPNILPEISSHKTALRDARPRQISANLFVLEDTCNVYVVRNGTHGLLIDFGSGMVLRHLAELGIKTVDWILHTHHHRDQAQGDGLAVERGIPIAAPAHERHLFEGVERFWQNRRVFELYTVRNDFFSLTSNIPVSASLHDYETFRWRGLEFLVQPTPGHTIGSVSLITKIDGMKVAFSGDLIYAPGKVQTLYDLQYYYGEHEGVDFSIYSLECLAALEPEILCPSHGHEFADPIPGMQDLSAKLREWFHYWHPGGSPPTIDYEPVPITPHLFAHPQASSTFYAIISGSGKAMFIDYGSASWDFFQSFRDATDTYDRMRFVEHAIDKLRAKHGLKTIDVAMPTHIHDDHVNGFPHLASKYGTRIWCYENMVEILENPRERNIGCLLGEAIPIDRSFRHNETFRWEEFEFTIKHSPGHTNYEMALFTTIDGKRIAFTGDAFLNYDNKGMRHNLIYRNDTKRGDYVTSIRNLAEMRPEIIAPGHAAPFELTAEMVRDFEARVREQDRLFTTMIADRDTDMGLDPAWVQILPYQVIAVRGKSFALKLRVRNHRSAEINVEVALCLPRPWQCVPESVNLKVAANGTSEASVEIVVPLNWRGENVRTAIAADVTADGVYLGQITEAVVDVRPADTKTARNLPDAKF
jgi:glyoxylase-like metal-dependent hydrolase (beta-lactamase superfamily II)